MTPTYNKDILLALMQEAYVMLQRMGLRDPASVLASMYDETKNAPQSKMKDHYAQWCKTEDVLYKSLFTK